jgi:mRNA interferase MazF
MDKLKRSDLVHPSRAEIWFVDLNPTKGHEQAGRRPCLVLSVDPLNHGPAEIVIVLPITSTNRRIPSQVCVKAPEGGLSNESYIKCEDIRSISKQRLIKRLGVVSVKTMAIVEDRIRILLGV